MTKQIIYAAPNYAELRRENGYFVDKTAYIAKLERISNPIFLRPRRFGKSFLCSMLHYYYDLHYKDDFAELFGDTWIGQNPTGKQNQYMVLHLNFSSIESGPTLADIEASFKSKCNQALDVLRIQYAPLLNTLPAFDINVPGSRNFSALITYTVAMDWPRLYVIIDEYDNFVNQLIVRHQNQLYDELTADGSFLKTFFKVLKEGRETRAIENIYITGILPITIDELASAFNVGTFLTLDPKFETMVGFTQDEVDTLLDEIFEDHAFPADLRSDVGELIKTNYDGYHFVEPASSDDSVSLYNTTILMYFLRYFTEHRKIPIHLTDANLKTDIGWVKRLALANATLAEDFVNQLTIHKAIAYNTLLLANQFNMAQFFEQQFFPISFFHLGLLTRQDEFHLTFPNLNMYQIFIEYFNKHHQLDTTNPYAEGLMRAYPEAQVSQFVIYCFANQDFRIFQI